jgi:macrolide transport system ATP-binding/permease protein
VAAGLFVRTLSNLESVDLGFNRENLLLFQMDALKAGHKSPEMAAFYGDLRKRFSQIPGVRQASLSDESMINAGWGIDIYVPGKPQDPETRVDVGRSRLLRHHADSYPRWTRYRGARPARLAGRGGDQRAVRQGQFWRSQSLGQHVLIGEAEKGKSREMEIVGVVRNTQYGGVKNKIRPVVYFSV